MLYTVYRISISLYTTLPSVGRSVREAATGIAVIPDRLQREHHAQYDAIVAGVQRELKRAGDAWNSEEAAALARLDTRLGVGGQAGKGLKAQSQGTHWGRGIVADVVVVGTEIGCAL